MKGEELGGRRERLFLWRGNPWSGVHGNCEGRGRIKFLATWVKGSWLEERIELWGWDIGSELNSWQLGRESLVLGIFGTWI